MSGLGLGNSVHFGINGVRVQGILYTLVSATLNVRVRVRVSVHFGICYIKC